MTTTGGRPHWGPFVALVALVVALDQATKLWIATELSTGKVIVFLEGALRLVYSKNSGALFGLFSGQVLLFGLLSLAVIGLIVMFHARSGRNPYMTLTLGLLLGGAIGNAIDRFRLGYVDRFRGRRHRDDKVLHLQRGRRSHQWRDRPALRRGDLAEARRRARRSLRRPREPGRRGCRRRRCGTDGWK